MCAKYAYNTRDIKFILKEWLPVEEIFAYPQYNQYYDKNDLDMLLEQMNKVARDIIAPTNDDGENNPPHIENGRVIGPPSFPETFKYFQRNGWGTSNIDENAEGTLPGLLNAFLYEMICAANPAFVYYPTLTTGAAKLIQDFGNEKLKEIFLPPMMDGRWSGTMCITEPAAGSDVGDITARAFPTEDEGIYKIKGPKIFISAGDGDHAENIVHMYLARIQGFKPGTKGLSLFIVPKFWPTEDGTLIPNDVETTGLEHKFGIKGCATVSLSFGDNNECRGYILGNVPEENGIGEGISQMFEMMNKERMESGVITTALAANEYWNAKNYCKERIQGRSISDPRGDRVEIINHEDIRRALLLNKSTTEACRAILARTYYYIDIKRNDPDPERRKWASNRSECLTPVCKAYPSDEAWNLLCETIQIYGGYGFTEDYPAARSVRDCKINSIYEGTNYIQSMDLISRKWRIDGGKAFAGILQDIENCCRENRNHKVMTKEFLKLERALSAYRQIQLSINEYLKSGKTGMVPSYSRRVLTSTGQLLGAYCLLDQTLLACNHLEEIDSSHYDYYFYYGKILSARYFVNNILPQVWLLAEIIADKDSSVIDAPLEIFDF